jgi:putative membrane protein insertion efficiency factor
MTTIDHQHEEPSLKDIPLNWRTIPRLPVLFLIRLYQKIISPALPAGTCRFHPTCSHYSFQAIAKYGLIKGGALSVWRVLRCQPLNPGGFDPVP